MVVAFGLLFLLEVDFIVWQERGESFADRAQRAGSALIDFAQERFQFLQRKTNEPFDQYERRISTENATTQSLYSKLYSDEVARLRNGFARRGLRTSELDEFYKEPGSAIAIHEIGTTLFDMGVELRSERLSGTLKAWLKQIVHV
jgi:hypothetical protein